MNVKGDDSINDRLGRYFRHGAAGVLGTEVGRRGGTVGLEDDRTVVAWAPMEGIGGTEEGDLGDAEGAGEVHGRGLNGEDQARATGEGGEGEEIEAAAEIAPPGKGGAGFPDGREVALLVAIGAAGEDAGETEVGFAPLDDFGPAIRGPVFLRAGGAGVDEDELGLPIADRRLMIGESRGIGDAGFGKELVGFAGSPFGEMEDDGGAGGDGEIKGAQKMEVVIDGVTLADRGGDELVVKDVAETGALDRLECDAAGGLREDGEERGTVGASEIEAEIVVAQEEMAPGAGILAMALMDEEVVHVINGREQFAGAGLDGQDDVGLGKVLAQGPEGGGGEDQIADPL
jgi:hypothetical protein